MKTCGAEAALTGSAKRKTAKIPRYREITQVLLGEIRAGHYEANARFPTEAQLSKRFGVSRFTVREALRAIEEMGLVSRRPGAGTTVETTDVDGRFASSINSLDDLLQYARATRFAVRSVSLVQPSAGLSAKIGCTAGEDWHKIVGVRSAEDSERPICLTEIYLPAELQKIVPLIGERPVPVYQMIEENFNLQIEKVVQDIAADTLNARTASLFGAEPGSPALRISRQYFTADARLIESAINVHPADAYRYMMTLRRQAAPSMGRRGGRVRLQASG
jgi:DNA-binding GntR family transcriptional regulator